MERISLEFMSNGKFRVYFRPNWEHETLWKDFDNVYDATDFYELCVFQPELAYRHLEFEDIYRNQKYSLSERL